jgi:hypothetical protein
MIETLIKLALYFSATTYGYGELMCGDIGDPKPCVKGAVTASGEVFDPDIASAAVPTPTDVKMVVHVIGIKSHDGLCIKVRVNDKSNPRWIGSRGLDLSPKAVELITGKKTKYFMSKIERCYNWRYYQGENSKEKRPERRETRLQSYPQTLYGPDSLYYDGWRPEIW